MPSFHLTLLIRQTSVGEISDYIIPEARKQAWRHNCGSSFDPIEAATEGSMDTHAVLCPKCRTSNALRKVSSHEATILNSVPV